MTPLKPTGFWSYASSDDTHSGGGLSQLRRLLADALQQQIGRDPRVHLFQDVQTIPSGADWERQIHEAIGGASFFIPIITPGFLQSEWCGQEVRRFAERQHGMGRDDLIFPIYYIDVEDFSGNRRQEMHDPAVLALLRKHQWVDFRELEYDAADSSAIRRQLGRVAQGIRGALYRDVTEVKPEPGLPPRGSPIRRVRAWTRPLILAGFLLAVLAAIVAYHETVDISSPKPATVASVPQPATVTPTQVKPAESSPRIVAKPSEPARPVAAPAFDNGTRDCDQICPRLVLIPKGTFAMGIPESETKRENTIGAETQGIIASPVHRVTIGSPFYLSEAPVTRGEYNECVKATKCLKVPAPSFTQTGNDPVVEVTYDDAKAYAGWLRQKTGKDYRLPSEAEWEYAARAGTRTRYYWGDDSDESGGHTVPQRESSTMPVKSFPPNQFGLFDMLGLVWQWTEDCYTPKYIGGLPADESPRTTGDCGLRIQRGGSWQNGNGVGGAGERARSVPGVRADLTGFRVARTF